ncbi:hypothetical protein [Burkholderia thailandensis]|uniref:hypothetical protein n=1 Tax=Burkholderia thailandensis TaxID=57975 RepID=UPI0012DAECB6|nr:hypothetical protein [Burkholderia thailandensis]
MDENAVDRAGSARSSDAETGSDGVAPRGCDAGDRSSCTESLDAAFVATRAVAMSSFERFTSRCACAVHDADFASRAPADVRRASVFLRDSGGPALALSIEFSIVQLAKIVASIFS